jgi:hypothetical protein
MRKLYVLGLIASFAAVCLFAGSSVLFAAEKGEKGEKEGKAGDRVRVTGTVKLTRDEAKKITAVTITDEKGVEHNITLDKKGLDLGEKYDGKKAMVAGTPSEKDGKKWITVQFSREAREGGKEGKEEKKPGAGK